MAFRLFRQVLPVSKSDGGRRVLIYGAGDGGELLLRELLNNRGLKYSPVGFLDDDPAKNGKVIHGLKVYGGNGDLNSVCTQHNVDEVLISSSRMPEERLKKILSFCGTQDIAVKRMRITIEDLTEK
jgi:UDP-GlcNAc:undecaprenyl-phosphate/decaprenyl-phosphate GlcNAc-1-phosphate transferase